MSGRQKIIIFYGIDFLLLNLSLLVVNYLKRDTIILSPNYVNLFFIYNLSLWVSGFLARKRPGYLTKNFFTNLLILIKANALLVYIVAMIIYAVGLSHLSRVQIFGTCLVFFILETIYIGLLGFFVIRKQSLAQEENIKRKTGVINNQYYLMLIDMVIVLPAFFLVLYLKNNTFTPPDNYDHVLFMFYAFFFPMSVVTQKYEKANFDNFANAITPCVKTLVGLTAGFSILIFSMRLFYFSRVMVFGTIFMVFFFECIIFFLYSRYRNSQPFESDIEDADSAIKAIMGVHYPVLDNDLTPEEITDPVKNKLKDALDFFNPRLFEFISRHVDLEQIDRKHSSILNSDKMFNLDMLDTHSYQLILNLQKINNVRWLNRYFLKTHTRLRKNGILIGKAHTIATHYNYFMSFKYKPVAELLYGVDFIWRRVFPKLPFLKKIYFAVTKGRSRIVSRAEIFGRLYFCGYKIIGEEVIDHTLYFIAQKVKIPSANQNPTYGPLIKLNRTGYNGQIIQVYKLRTMHPYSEFLQEYVYEKYDLDEGGKFNDDFRVTTWGKVFRKYWIDELPMLYNWLIGDMKLLGVRPLSKQYFNLYTPELQSLRVKVKPGLVPPFYADLPETLDDIIASELNYIKSYLKMPARTQLKYLWQSGVNILVKGARSK